MFTYAADGTPSGIAVVSDRVVALIDARFGIGAALDLHRALADGDDFAAALARIEAEPTTGAAAVVEVTDARTRTLRVAVRGPLTVELGGGGSTRLGADRRDGWTVTDARGIRTFRLELPGGAEGASLPLRGGVVLSGRIEFSARRTSGAAPRPEPDDADAEQDAEQDAGALVASEAGTASDPGPSDATRPVPIAARTADRDPYAELDTSASTVIEPPVADPEDPNPEDPDPGRPDPDAPAAAPTGWVFGLPDGTELDAAQPSVIGRRPWSQRREPQAYVHVVVPSPHREISGEHLRLGFDGELPTALDLDSTNGTLLFSADGSPRLLRGGETAQLGPGDILDLGEGCRVSVLRREPAADAVAGRA